MNDNSTASVTNVKEFDIFLVALRICSIRRFLVRLSGIARYVCSNYRINGFIALATCTVERTESLVGARRGQRPVNSAFVHSYFQHLYRDWPVEEEVQRRTASRENHVSIVEARPTSNWRRRVDWLAGLVAACSILTLSARHWWVADLIANLRVQLIIGMLGTILLLSIMRRWRILAAVATLTMWQATAMRAAYQTGDIEPNQSNQRLRVFMANVLTRNQHHDQIIAQIRAADPDVIAILELSSKLEASLQREFSSTHEYFVSESQDDGNFGIGLWSRYPLSNGRVFHLNAPILPSIEADIELPSCTIHVMATHPLPPIGTRNFGHRNRHLSLLAQRMRNRQQIEPSCSQILLGDLNLTPWSPLFDDFLTSTGLQSAAAGRGLQPTWYRWPAFPFGLLLDHGLYSRNMHCDQRAILSANGSDHRAVVFDFSVNESR